jgi:hypothetical protein
MHRPVLALAALFLLLPACRAQVTPEYAGEPIVTIRGSVVTGPTPAPASVTAAIVWFTSATVGTSGVPRFVGSRVTVNGAFPAQFTLTIYDPPPAEGEILVPASPVPGAPPPPPNVLPAMVGSGAWQGVLAALADGASLTDLHPSDVLGVDPDHILFYFDHDEFVPEGGFPAEEGPAKWAKDYLLPPTKGYHLAIYDHGSPAETASYVRCLYNGVCVQETGDSNEWFQAQSDWQYARCIGADPSAQTCVFDAAMPYSPQSVACNQLSGQAVSMETGCFPPDALAVMPNARGFDDPATIVLGEGIWRPFTF